MKKLVHRIHPRKNIPNKKKSAKKNSSQEKSAKK